jgi:hypothetical protein
MLTSVSFLRAGVYMCALNFPLQEIMFLTATITVLIYFPVLIYFMHMNVVLYCLVFNAYLEITGCPFHTFLQIFKVFNEMLTSISFLRAGVYMCALNFPLQEINVFNCKDNCFNLLSCFNILLCIWTWFYTQAFNCLMHTFLLEMTVSACHCQCIELENNAIKRYFRVASWPLILGERYCNTSARHKDICCSRTYALTSAGAILLDALHSLSHLAPGFLACRGGWCLSSSAACSFFGALITRPASQAQLVCICCSLPPGKACKQGVLTEMLCGCEGLLMSLQPVKELAGHTYQCRTAMSPLVGWTGYNKLPPLSPVVSHLQLRHCKIIIIIKHHWYIFLSNFV